MNKKQKILVALIGTAIAICAFGALFFLVPTAQNVFNPLFVIVLLIVLFCILAVYMYWTARFYEEGTEYSQKKKR